MSKDKEQHSENSEAQDTLIFTKDDLMLLHPFARDQIHRCHSFIKHKKDGADAFWRFQNGPLGDYKMPIENRPFYSGEVTIDVQASIEKWLKNNDY